MAYSGAFGTGGFLPELPMAEEGIAMPERPQERRSSFDIQSILKKIEAAGMEADDLLMALMLFLMYRESGDTDLLILLGVMLLT